MNVTDVKRCCGKFKIYELINNLFTSSVVKSVPLVTEIMLSRIFIPEMFWPVFSQNLDVPAGNQDNLSQSAFH